MVGYGIRSLVSKKRRERARKQRVISAACCMCNSMGLSFVIFANPPGGDATSDDCLPALVDVHVLDCDFLPAFVPMLCERFDLAALARVSFAA